MLRAYPTKRAARGFTLIEVLVALSVFAVITLLAWRGLDSIATTKLRLDREMRMWRELELVFERVGLDITQIAPRSWTDSAGKQRSAVQATNTESGNECQLDVLRFGSDQEPVHLRYIVKDARLTLEIVADSVWSAAAQSAPAGDKPYLLLENVEHCDMSFIDSDNKWQSRWPVNSVNDATRPRGMRLRLTLAGRGEFERTYYIP